MKKTLAIVVTLLLALTLCVSLVACGGGVEGTYKFQSMKMSIGGAVEINIEAGKEIDMTQYGGEKMTVKADDITIELKADGKFVMKGEFMGQSMAQEGTWEQKDGKIAFTVNGETAEATLSNGVLSMDMDGMGEMKFKK